MKPLYKNPSSKAAIRRGTEQFRESIQGEITDHYVETSFGSTYVMELGDPSMKTVVLLHGGGTNHTIILYLLRELVGQYHILCPDLPGHAGFSAETRIDPSGDDYGHWLDQVLDEVQVETADFIGCSYGGFVLGRLIAVAPERIQRAVLLVPGGIVPMPELKLLRHIVMWQVLYGLTGKESFFLKIMDALFTDYEDPHLIEFFRMVLVRMRIDTRPMKLSTEEECVSFQRPMLILGAEHDVIFNCRALGKRVKELYPRATFEVLKNSKHTPSIEERNIKILNERMIAFLEGT